jgi:hypothetical protein
MKLVDITPSENYPFLYEVQMSEYYPYKYTTMGPVMSTSSF